MIILEIVDKNPKTAGPEMVFVSLIISRLNHRDNPCMQKCLHNSADMLSKSA